MANKKEKINLSRTVDFAIEKAKKYGADSVSVTVSKTSRNKVVCRDKKWEEISGSTSQTLDIKIFADGRYASHSTSDLNEDSMNKFIKDAVALTGFLVKDPHRKLPDKSLYSGRLKTGLDLFDSSYSSITLDKRKEIALKACESASNEVGKSLISASGTYSDSFSEFVMGQSNGFSEQEKETFFYFYADASVKDPKGGRPSDYEISGSRFSGKLDSPEIIGKKAAQRALKTIGAEKLDSGTYDIIIENRSVGRIMGGLLGPLHAGSIYNKTSFLEDKIGKTIASKNLTITDDPLIAGGFGSFRFDSEGITARKRNLIENGVLKTWLVDTYYGSKLGIQTNSGSTGNIVISSGLKSVDEILKSLKKVIYITRFIGGNSNSTTGDFSHGIAGFLFEDGKLSKPLIEMNISGNHSSFWTNLTDTSNDVYLLSRYRTPSLLLKNITIAGK
ncbi:TldD/PmbA family protein [Myxococcota bacterium]|nr:TldD/PmbA family protein [Myxococcota bacterium]MBU1382513.1 TldD/PmbA family protein [Myxococcota bacterium]MBU1497587.1 TldD/PmbA family protein [Myxococcota bacterium]